MSALLYTSFDHGNKMKAKLNNYQWPLMLWTVTLQWSEFCPGLHCSVRQDVCLQAQDKIAYLTELLLAFKLKTTEK